MNNYQLNKAGLWGNELQKGRFWYKAGYPCKVCYFGKTEAGKATMRRGSVSQRPLGVISTLEREQEEEIIPVLVPVYLFWSDTPESPYFWTPGTFSNDCQASDSISCCLLQFPETSGSFQAWQSIHCWKLEGWVFLGPEQIIPDTKTLDVPTTVSSVLSRSRATNTTTSTSFLDSLPSCSQCWGASLTALSMVRTGLRVFSSRFLGKVLWQCRLSSAAFSVEGEVCPDQWNSLLNKKYRVAGIWKLFHACLYSLFFFKFPLKNMFIEF